MSVKDQLPVDDAMPERLPQARLTIIVESSGLHQFYRKLQDIKHLHTEQKIGTKQHPTELIYNGFLTFEIAKMISETRKLKNLLLY